jgi:O-antigen/teichoic acid export membrane protein
VDVEKLLSAELHERKEKTGWSGSVLHITAVMLAVVFAAAVLLSLLPPHPAFSTKTLLLLFGIFAGLCVTFYFVVRWVFQRPAELSKNDVLGFCYTFSIPQIVAVLRKMDFFNTHSAC